MLAYRRRKNLQSCVLARLHEGMANRCLYLLSWSELSARLDSATILSSIHHFSLAAHIKSRDDAPTSARRLRP